MHISLEDIDTSLARRIRPLTADEMTALEDSVLREGIMVPILVNAYGKLVDGYHRLQLALKHDLECPLEVLDETDEAVLARLAGDLNSCRRQMTKAERDAAIVEARAAGVKIAEIAKELGCGVATVQRVTAEAGMSRKYDRTSNLSNDRLPVGLSPDRATPTESRKGSNDTFAQEIGQSCPIAEPTSETQPQPTPEPEPTVLVCEMQTGGLAASPTLATINQEPKLIEASAGRYEQSAPTEPAWLVVLGALVNLTERSPVSPTEFLDRMPEFMLRNPKTRKRIEGASVYLNALSSYFEDICPTQ